MKKLYITLFLAFAFIVNHTYADHFVGYDMCMINIKNTNGSPSDLYKFRLRIFRDVLGIPIPNSATFTIYKNSNNAAIGTFTTTKINPQTFLSLTNVIRGWSEIFPQFSTGSYSGNPDGTTSFFDFGAGVMFIPSGLAYYGTSTGTIPAYSPLIFSFKLYEIERTDQDGDGIPSYQEDLNDDRYVYVLNEGIVNIDDTDGDEVPDFLDIDDDGDFFTTVGEIENPLTGEPFPFADIPTCTDGKKKHLSNICH